MTAIALIPARSGSKRIPNKNVKMLAGHPLLAYTIAAAKQSGLFERIIVSSDSESYLKIARRYGAEPDLRYVRLAKDDTPDFDWVFELMVRHWTNGHHPDFFAILRPTSPFRSAASIKRAYGILEDTWVDSVRAVRPARKHPGKMWLLQGDHMTPLFAFRDKQPWHSLQSQSLPKVYEQTAGLEFARMSALWDTHTISGNTVAPIILDGAEALDIDDNFDWAVAEVVAKAYPELLPKP